MRRRPSPSPISRRSWPCFPTWWPGRSSATRRWRRNWPFASTPFSASPPASRSSSSASPRRSCWRTPAGMSRTPCSTPRIPAPSTPGWGCWRMPFKSTSTSAATPTWRWGWGACWGSSSSKNFDAPYLAESITDLWRRWHISLSSVLRDYLYFPLGGNRLGPTRTYVNLAVVMLLGGLWHGAKWSFVVVGRLPRAAAGLRALARQTEPLPARCRRAFASRVTFLLMLFSWVLFRAENLTAAGRYFGAMFGLSPATGASALLAADIYSSALSGGDGGLRRAGLPARAGSRMVAETTDLAAGDVAGAVVRVLACW